MPELMLTVEGRPLRVPVGISVLAALQGAQRLSLRRSLSGQRRGPLCGMGACFECRARVDGVLVRTCLIPVQPGMLVELLE